MSDPMTNFQIEDVLSSIRRLVAEGEKSRVVKGETAAVDTSPPSAGTGRLMLTPSLRVSDDGFRIGMRAESEKSPIKPEAATPDVTAVQVADIDDLTRATALSLGSVPPLVLSASAKADLPVHKIFDDAPRNTTKREERVARRPRLHLSPVDRVKADDEVPAFRHFDRAKLSAEKTPLHELDVAKNAPDADADFEDDMRTDTAADYLSDDEIIASAGLDEAALRSLVVDIIREELHGEWGERITRNVRKLVRSEINRVLSAQEFD